ncbi:MAG: hypothetical protein CL878_10760, partial [Dehalococcoidia bacterium]|nr:hypothetical protein [Dehalococcoidia bacterium]
LDALKAAQFRVAGNGRFEWTVTGEVYAKQYFPPSIADMAYPPERLVAEMDFAGVDRALLHRTPYLGIGNDFIAECVRRFPDRLLGLAHAEEWLIAADPEAAVRKVERAVREQGLSGLQFLPPQLDLYSDGAVWDGPRFRPFWDGVASLGIPVFFSLRDRVSPAVESYRDELGTLLRWMERYPEVKAVHTHGLVWRLFMHETGLDIPEWVWDPFANPNLSLQLMFPIALGAVWDYPMPEVRPTIETCVERLGADRLMWGTDMPIVTRFWTYRQNIDFIRRYCDFPSGSDLALILGGTTAHLLGEATS